jgi:CHAT domain-containing protein
MTTRCVLVVALLMFCAVVRLAQLPDQATASIREADERITTVEERQRAVTTLLAQADELRNSGRTIEAARALNRVGRFQIRLLLKSEAVATFQEALTLLAQTPDVETRIESLNGLGEAYDKLSECVRAQGPLDEAIALSKQNGSKAGEAEALLTLSDCQNYHDHALALQSARTALELWRSLNDKRRVAESHAAIGYYEMVQNNLIESDANFNAALAIWRELNVASEQAEALINLGYIEYRKGAWQDSLNFYTEAQTLIDPEAEPYQMGQITAGLAESFIETGLPEIGLTKFRDALAFYRLTKNKRAIAAAEWGIGRAQFLSGDYAGALASLETARADAGAIHEVMLTAMCDDFLGRTRGALNQLPEALARFEAALAGFTRAKNPLEIARAHALISGVSERQGKFAMARTQYQTALEGFRALSDQVNESQVLFALGHLQLRENYLNEAETYLRQSIDLTENVRRISTSRDLAAAFSATIHDRYQTYVECLMRKHQVDPGRGLDVRAFEVSDLARARSLVEMLSATQANLVSSLDANLAERDISLRQSLRVKEDARIALLSTAYKKEDLDTLNRELTTLESEYKRLNEEIGARYPAYEQIARPKPLTLAEIQERALIDDQTILLEYSLGENHSYLWAVTRTQMSSYELPGRAEIEKVAFRVHGLLTGGDRTPSMPLEQHLRESEEELTAATAALSQMLLSPVAGQLGARRLLIVADGALQYIPFQILSLPPANPTSNNSSTALSTSLRPLILDHEIVNEPSGAILALTSALNTNQPVRGSVAVLADPVFQPDDPRITSTTASSASPSINSQPKTLLPAFRDAGSPGANIPRLLASRDEARAIMAIVPWQTGFEAVDFEASRSTVAAARLDQFRIVHFATHAFIDEKRPESSGIMLSLFDRKGAPQDGLLRLNDIYNLRLPVNLVVLSACQTGLGKEVRGEGLIGLTRGFMYAGASGVVASLWKVDDEATAELMKNFYRGLFQDDLPPAAALRQAQIAMRQQKRWHAPFYWAGFVIQGRYDQTESMGASNPAAQRLVVIGGLLSAIMLAACLVLRRRRSSRV